MKPASADRTQSLLQPALSSKELRAHPAVRNYTLLCLIALFLLVVCLVDGLGWWCLLPALIGGGSLIASWSLGPPLVLLSLTGLLLHGGHPHWAHKQPTMDLILCAAVLAYVMGHYRLLSLVRNVFPVDPRRRRGGGFTDATERRSAEREGPWEMALMLLALPLWTALSVASWSCLMLIEEEPPEGISTEVFRVFLVIWAIVAALAVAAAVVGYARQAAATPEESLLFLQDQLWRGTRREQSRLNHWLVWARKRAQRRRES
jgi:hypothetical protein